MSYNSSSSNDVVKTALGGARRKKRTGYRVKFSNKIRAMGITDPSKKTVTINRKYHKVGNKNRPTKSRKKPEMLRTRIHERMHVQHPKMTEKQAEKKAKRLAKTMTKKQKQKEYSRVIIYKH